jgi:hypothetical protein
MFFVSLLAIYFIVQGPALRLPSFDQNLQGQTSGTLPPHLIIVDDILPPSAFNGIMVNGEALRAINYESQYLADAWDSAQFDSKLVIAKKWTGVREVTYLITCSEELMNVCSNTTLHNAIVKAAGENTDGTFTILKNYRIIPQEKITASFFGRPSPLTCSAGYSGQTATCGGTKACCDGTCKDLPVCTGKPDGEVDTCGPRQFYCCGGQLRLAACGGTA